MLEVAQVNFIGRKEELNALEKEFRRDSGFVVIYGRRRIGKTTLIKEFIKDKQAFYFLATEEVESQSMKRLAGVVARVTGNSMLQRVTFTDWLDLFREIASWFNTLGLFRLPTHLTMGFGTLLIAHITFNIPYVILSVGPKLRQMDRNLVDAAMDLGCTWMQAFWKVIIPEIKPGIVSGALTAFTMSIDDFVISYFTAGSSSSTLAMTIYGMTKKKVTPEINAISTLLFVTVLVLLAVINVREARQERKLAAEQRR